MQTIYNLICEDASHLGGLMGTEYTTHIFSKVFTDLHKAKEYAIEYQGKENWPTWAKWENDDKHHWYDSAQYIWKIVPQELE